MKTFLETPRHKQNIIFSKYSSKLCLNESKMKKSKKKGVKIGHFRDFTKIFTVTFVPFLKPFFVTERCFIPFWIQEWLWNPSRTRFMGVVTFNFV